MYGDISSPNYLEHSVAEKPNKRTKTLKAVIISAALVVFLLLFWVLSVFAKAMIIIIPMVTVLIVFAAFIFWKFTKVEYDYVISGGEMQMHMVYSGRSRKELFCFKLSSAELFADKKQAPVDDSKYSKAFYCVSDMNAENIVYAVFKNDDGEKCIAYFEAPKKAYGILKFYNSSAYKIGKQ